MARLQMSHPSKASADEAYGFFMSSEELQHKSDFVREMIDPKDSGVASMLFWSVIKIAQLLELAGRNTDARLILDFGRRRMPKYFTPRLFNNPYKDRHVTRALDTGDWDPKRQILRTINSDISGRKREVSDTFAKYNERYKSED
ncbi:hypothetical protein LTR15_003685 [Elasticomyces elasticus]|nr:hypothetical protein LTR15_003685 [Elasticomyces elasticus]